MPTEQKEKEVMKHEKKRIGILLILLGISMLCVAYFPNVSLYVASAIILIGIVFFFI